MAYFDDPRSRQSEELAFLAEQAARRGEVADAKSLFSEAAQLEAAIAMEVGADAPRVRSALAVSAVSLALKAEAFDDAAATACHFLARPALLVPDAIAELRTLLDRAWQTQALRQLVGPDGGFVPLEARLSGGQIGLGLAPSQVIGERRDVIAPLVIRVAEFLEDRAFRKFGPSQIASRVQIYEAPALAASYSLRFLLVKPGQQVLDGVRATPQAVVEKLMEIATAVAEEPDRLQAIVADRDYQKAFMRAFRDLSPDGTLVGKVELSTGAGPQSLRRASFTPDTQKRITRALMQTAEEAEFTYTGMLKNVKLRGVEPTIGLETAEGFKAFRIEKGAHDDTIGVKLNRRVRASGRRRLNEAGEPSDWADDIALLEEGG